MKITVPLVSTTSWTDIYALDGVESKFAHTLENTSSSPIFVSLTTDPDKDNSYVVYPNEVLFVPASQDAFLVIAAVNVGLLGKVFVTRALSTDVRATVRKFSRLVEPRVLAQNLTQIEVASVEGRMYKATVDISIPASSEIWYNFTAPADKECAFTDFNFTPFYTGFEAQLYTDSTGMTVSGTKTNRCMNTAFAASTATLAELSAAPTTIGSLLAIPAFIPVSGLNVTQRDAGTTSGDTGYTIFAKSTGFQARLINTSGNANRVVAKFVWLEAGEAVIDNF